MEKVIVDGKVAVLVSHGFGAGWSTWNEYEDILMFHPKLVGMVEQGKEKQISEEWCENNLGLKDIYCGGASDLTIYWLDEGTPFRIDEYDGSESLITSEQLFSIA